MVPERVLPYSTVERVDCTVAEQYNVSPLRGESTLSTECRILAGDSNGDRRQYPLGLNPFSLKSAGFGRR